MFCGPLSYCPFSLLMLYLSVPLPQSLVFYVMFCGPCVLLYFLFVDVVFVCSSSSIFSFLCYVLWTIVLLSFLFVDVVFVCSSSVYDSFNIFNIFVNSEDGVHTAISQKYNACIHIICYSAIRQGIQCDIPGLRSIFPEAQLKGIYIISREYHIIYPL